MDGFIFSARVPIIYVVTQFTSVSCNLTASISGIAVYIAILVWFLRIV